LHPGPRGHAEQLLRRLQPGGRLLGVDADQIELPKTEARLRTLGFGPETFTAHRTNFAGLPQVLAEPFWPGRIWFWRTWGFPPCNWTIRRGLFREGRRAAGHADESAARAAGGAWLAKIQPAALARVLVEKTPMNPTPTPWQRRWRQAILHHHGTVEAIRRALPRLSRDETGLTVRRVFKPCELR